MKNETTEKVNLPEKRNPLWFRTFGMMMRILVPLVFLATGLILLYLALPGWSLIIGIPSTTFGIVFLLYTYDELCCQDKFDGGGDDKLQK